MATEISDIISWHDVLHPDIGVRGKGNFPQHGTAGQCWGRFVDDGDTTGVAAQRVTSTTTPAQRHSQVTYLADGALRVKADLEYSMVTARSTEVLKATSWSTNDDIPDAHFSSFAHG